MKKITLIIAAIGFISITTTTGQFNVGIKGGASFSDANADVFVDAINDAPKTYTSFVIGGFAEIPFTSNFSFQPEVLFTDRGFSVGESTSFNVFGAEIPVGASVSTSIKYVETPLLMKASMGSGKAKIYGIAGPSIGYATSAKLKSQVNLLINFNLPDVNIDLSNDIYNRTQLAGILGGGAEYGTSTGKLFTDLRYQHSFTNIISSPLADMSIKNKGFQWTVGYSHAF